MFPLPGVGRTNVSKGIISISISDEVDVAGWREGVILGSSLHVSNTPQKPEPTTGETQRTLIPFCLEGRPIEE